MNNAKCQKIQALFEKYFDRSLKRKERSELEQHIEQCQECRSILKQEKYINDSLSDLPDLQCPQWVIERIKEATFQKRKHSSESRSPNFLLGFFRWQTVTVGVAVAAVLYLLFFNLRDAGNEPELTTYSQEIIEKASLQAKWSMALVAQILDNTEKRVVQEVLLKELPQSIRGCIRNGIPLIGG